MDTVGGGGPAAVGDHKLGSRRGVHLLEESLIVDPGAHDGRKLAEADGFALGAIEHQEQRG